MKIQNIFNKKNNNSVYVIAEMAWSHDGSFINAKKIIKGAAVAGADAISLHITDVPGYMIKSYGQSIKKASFAWQTLENQEGKMTAFNYLNKISLKDNDWKKLFTLAKNLGLEICTMPNDWKSLQLCKRLRPDAYVIGPASLLEEDFVIAIAKRKKPVILRIGGSTLPEIRRLVKLVKKYGTGKVILLSGVQLYPTRTQDMNLRQIPYLSKIFKLPIGLADHIDGESDLAYLLPLLSIPLGARVIEKHLTYDRSKKGEDYESALEAKGFKKFVRFIREAEKSLGSAAFKKLSPAEIKYRELSRKRAVAKKEIKKGERIIREKITFKRATEGIYPNEIRRIIGKKAIVNIEEDSPILLKNIK